jgi:hypothetical protein
MHDLDWVRKEGLDGPIKPQMHYPSCSEDEDDAELDQYCVNMDHLGGDAPEEGYVLVNCDFVDIKGCPLDPSRRVWFEPQEPNPNAKCDGKNPKKHGGKKCAGKK